MKKKNFKGISTVTLHTASTENDNFSHTTPIYATSTFTFGSTDEGMERTTGESGRVGEPRFGSADFGEMASEGIGRVPKVSDHLIPLNREVREGETLRLARPPASTIW